LKTYFHIKSNKAYSDLLDRSTIPFIHQMKTFWDLRIDVS